MVFQCLLLGVLSRSSLYTLAAIGDFIIAFRNAISENMNNISISRAEIKKYFDPKQILEGSQSRSTSPSGSYKLETAEYQQNKPDRNWTVTKVSIFDTRSHELMFEFFTDYHSFFHEWLVKENTEYLVGGEVLCGGQTVIDLSARKMKSYSPPEDGFIWSDLYFSPCGSSLAVIGCHWACPYEVRVYDFSKPMDLPLSEIKIVTLHDSELDNVDWIDNRNFKTKNYDGSIRTHSLDAA